MVTCRVIMSIGSTNCNRKRPIPERFVDHQFTAKGHGEILRTARNMAAKLIINKLTVAGLFHEE
ncbi:hypothetical protein BLA29_003161 [Euroglyphus maynei]|uniref:Uncharacterized protein n=1 Tax=Euroglyphus maynei TaxID=6958 RepID=A0A1Y3B358_EURMA|nr:hypothetical protein BLA29_003161 [Euroglyphus maynei]